MHRLPFVLAASILTAISLRAEQLPPISAETLAGNKLELPGAVSGHVSVLCIGFTHGSQTQVKHWTSTLRQRFQNDSSIAVYPVAVLEDAPRLVRGMILHGIKGDVSSSDWNKFFVVFKGENELKQIVAFAAGDDAYLILMNSSGGISYKLHGPPNAASVQDLATRAANLSLPIRTSQ
jgi:ATP10 protein